MILCPHISVLIKSSHPWMYSSTFFSPVSYLSSAMKPCANRCNIDGQQLPTLRERNTLCPFAHPVACCCMLLGVVEQSLKPVKLYATTHNIVGHSLKSNLKIFHETTFTVEHCWYDHCWTHLGACVSKVASHYVIKSFETSWCLVYFLLSNSRILLNIALSCWFPSFWNVTLSFALISFVLKLCSTTL